MLYHSLDTKLEDQNTGDSYRSGKEFAQKVKYFGRSNAVFQKVLSELFLYGTLNTEKNGALINGFDWWK